MSIWSCASGRIAHVARLKPFVTAYRLVRNRSASIPAQIVVGNHLIELAILWLERRGNGRSCPKPRETIAHAIESIAVDSIRTTAAVRASAHSASGVSRMRSTSHNITGNITRTPSGENRPPSVSRQSSAGKIANICIGCAVDPNIRIRVPHSTLSMPP